MDDDLELESTLASIAEDTQRKADTEIAVTKLLGFTKVDGKDAPVIVDFVNTIEAITSKSGADALVAWLKESGPKV
jgi:hypothetical protein